MKFSRIIAMTAAISITAGVFYNVGRTVDVNTANSSSIFGDINGDGTISPTDASILLSYYAYLSTVVGDPISLEEYLVYGPSGPVSPDISDGIERPIDSSVKTGGKTFTIASWSTSEVPYLIAQWKGRDYKTIVNDLANNKVEGIRFISFDCVGGEASDKYNRLLAGGEDIDVYFCEDDWGRLFIDNDDRTLDLSKLGLTDADFKNVYSYTDEIGKDSDGVRKGASWQCWAGAYAYRADYAEEYLGVKTPEEMQSRIGDWDKFYNTAKEMSESTNNKVAMADSLGGMYTAFINGRTDPLVVDGKLNLSGNDTTEFIEIAKKLWDIGGVSKNSQWTQDWIEAGYYGSTMGYFVPTWGLDSFLIKAAGGYNSRTYGQWAVCEGPQPYYWGGSWILVNPETDNGEEARDFILSAVCNNNQMKEYAVNKPEFVNNSAVMDELIANNTVFNEKVTGNFKNKQNVYEKFANNAKALDYSGVITPYDQQAEKLLTKTLNDIIMNDRTLDDIGDVSIY